MNRKSAGTRLKDFEELGYRTMLECDDVEKAKNICSLVLQTYQHVLEPKRQQRNSELGSAKQASSALHSQLYDGPIPANDAKMLSLRKKILVVKVSTVIAFIACLVGNMSTFYLMGFEPLPILLCGTGFTGLPLVIGHMAYEWIVSRSRLAKLAMVLAAAALAAAGILICGQSRRDMVDRSASTPTVHSYVDGEDAETNQPVRATTSDKQSESKIHKTLGDGLFLIMLAAELALVFLFGYLVEMCTEDDYTAWRELQKQEKQIVALELRIAELESLPEIAKKCCLAGILRAQNTQSRRRPPYHRKFMWLLPLLLLFTHSARAQTTEHYEGILLDTSASISRGGKTNELFHEYLIATRKLLLTEPPNSRVWVSSISTNSFGGTHEILKGWTPAAHGVFTDDLNRARAQLAASFEATSSGLAPTASGTDIFGGLWRLKIQFESDKDASVSPSKEIWIFSDMINDTKQFPMPELIELGSQRMLERAKAEGLIVSLKGYKIHVCGASTAGMTPKEWTTLKIFWTDYFVAAGAELIQYSTDLGVKR